jgi:microcystin-dependent protein
LVHPLFHFLKRKILMDPFIGEIKMVGCNFAPRGYALCDGALMPIAQNAALFSLLGTMYGGDGIQTFALPDYRGRGPVGMGQGPGLSAPVVQGQVAGFESVTLTLGNLPAHTHAATTSGMSATPQATTALGVELTPTDAIIATPIAGDLFALPSAANVTMAPIPVTGTVTILPVGGNLPVGVRNPYLGTNFVIALQGVYPSRN